MESHTSVIKEKADVNVEVDEQNPRQNPKGREVSEETEEMNGEVSIIKKYLCATNFLHSCMVCADAKLCV